MPTSTAITAPTDPRPLASAAAGASQVGPVVDSHQLLQGQKMVAIHHNGAVYRLQSTKLGKLILTK